MFGLRPGDRVLAVAPHPDDETLGAGGTIARLTNGGITVHVLAVACTTSTPAAGTGSDPALRQAEFEAACDALGVADRRLAWIDDDRARNPGAYLPDLVALIESERGAGLRYTWPQALLIPAGGHHQDHQAVHRAGRAAARPGTAHAPRILLGYEGPEDRAWACASECWSIAVDTTNAWPAKEKALLCYSSQLRMDPHPRSTDRILAFDRAAGAAINCETAERFLPYRMAF